MTTAAVSFRELQRSLHPLPAHETIESAQQTIVVLPSLDMDAHVLERHVITMPAYEERFLYLLFLLRRPDVRIVFTSSLPVASDVVDYYLGLISGNAGASVGDRLFLVSPDDPSPRPLAAKLLDRPDLLAAILSPVVDRKGAFIVPYNVGALERDLALELGLPIYGPTPELGRFGTKCGARELFAAEGVSLPAGREHVADPAGLTEAIMGIRALRPRAPAVVVKLNDRVYGEGNRTLSLAGLPPPDDPGERDAVEALVASLPREYLADLADDPGIVEELVEATEIRSPSVVMRILADGTPGLVYAQDQLLGGESGQQQYVGSRFPVQPEYAELIVDEAAKVRDRLLREGMVGRFGIDFVVARDEGGPWHSYAVEINLREGGTSHPFGALYLLAGGEYDPATGRFLTAAGEERYYTASDNLVDPRLVGTPVRELLERATESGLEYDGTAEVGCVFHMLRSLPVEGKCGVTAIGRTREHADELYAGTQQLLSLVATESTGSPA
jgi:hypothetical protein